MYMYIYPTIFAVSIYTPTHWEGGEELEDRGLKDRKTPRVAYV